MEKYGTAGQATDGDIVRYTSTACWIPKTTNTHSEYVILIAFSTATMITRTLLSVTLYVHCLSRFHYIQKCLSVRMQQAQNAR
jgi:hypothetical protein